MKEIKLAIPTEGGEGLEDTVSEVFGRAKTFTIVEICEGSISDVKAAENPTVSYKHGAGPIVVKMLVDMGVNAVMAREFGPGALALLEQHNIGMIKVEAGISVAEAVENTLKEFEERV